MKLISKAVFICILSLFLGGRTQPQVITPATDTTSATVDSLKSAAQSFVARVNAVEARTENLAPAIIAERITTNEIKAWVKRIRGKKAPPTKPKAKPTPKEPQKPDIITRTIYKTQPTYGGTPYRQKTEREKREEAGLWRRIFPKKHK